MKLLLLNLLMLFTAAASGFELQSLFKGLFKGQPKSEPVQRNFPNLTTTLGIPDTRLVVNSTELGYAAGAVLATTFLGAAVATNFPGLLNVFDVTEEKSMAAERVSTQQHPLQPSCDCEQYCHYYEKRKKRFLHF